MLMQIRKKRWLCVVLGLVLLLTIVNISDLRWLYVKMYETSFSKQSFNYTMDIDFSFIFDSSLPKPKTQVNPKRFAFKHAPSLLCHEECLGLVLVKSGVSNFFHRKIVRETWFTELSSHRLRGAFLIGETTQLLTSTVDQEAQVHKDIIQYNFTDSYYNNTFKTMAAFHWQKQFCREVKYVVMCDDDYYVNVPNLQQYLLSIEPENYNRFITGYVFSDSSPQRNPKSKWYIPLEEYEWSRWPPYPTAGFYVVSKPTADYISEAMPYVKLLNFDDVYLGVILWKLKIKPTNDDKMILFSPPLLLQSYLDIVGAHTIGQPELIKNVWNVLHNSSP